MWRRRIANYQNPNVRPEFRQCYKCNFEAITGPVVCPRCHNPKFFTSDQIRTRGIALTIVGAFLVVFMGGIAVVVGFLVFGSFDGKGPSKRFDQEPLAVITVFSVFAGLIAFGFNGIVGGIWMLVFGRRNRFTIWVMWATLILTFALGGLFRAIV